MKLNCLIVDDEPVARNGLAEDVSQFPSLQVSGLAENAVQALEFLNGHEDTSILFLDLDMPGLNGLDFLKLVRIKPVVIITTAYPQYAINGFELGVIDYLLKPISMQRLETAVAKAIKWLDLNKTQPISDDFLYIKCNGKWEKIFFSEILYIEAANNYVFIHTREKRFITYHTLKGIEARLPPDQFVKVHKSFIVSRGHVGRVLGSEILINGIQIPLSRNFKDSFQKNVVSARALKK